MRSHASSKYDTSERQCEQSHTSGDAIDVAVQKRHTESTSTSFKLKVVSTQRNSKGGGSRTLENTREHHYKKIQLPSRVRESKQTDVWSCLKSAKEKAELVHEQP